MPFQLYTARPYALGLETLLWSDNSQLPGPYNVLSVKGIHDLYHVEPQTKCMLTADGKHAVDMFVRCALVLLAPVSLKNFFNLLEASLLAPVLPAMLDILQLHLHKCSLHALTAMQARRQLWSAQDV